MAIDCANSPLCWIMYVVTRERCGSDAAGRLASNQLNAASSRRFYNWIPNDVHANSATFSQKIAEGDRCEQVCWFFVKWVDEDERNVEVNRVLSLSCPCLRWSGSIPKFGTCVVKEPPFERDKLTNWLLGPGLPCLSTRHGHSVACTEGMRGIEAPCLFSGGHRHTLFPCWMELQSTQSLDTFWCQHRRSSGCRIALPRGTRRHHGASKNIQTGRDDCVAAVTTLGPINEAVVCDEKGAWPDCAFSKPWGNMENCLQFELQSQFYKTFTRPIAKVLVVAVFTYQFVYWGWVKLEADEHQQNTDGMSDSACHVAGAPRMSEVPKMEPDKMQPRLPT